MCLTSISDSSDTSDLVVRRDSGETRSPWMALLDIPCNDSMGALTEQGQNSGEMTVGESRGNPLFDSCASFPYYEPESEGDVYLRNVMTEVDVQRV